MRTAQGWEKSIEGAKKFAKDPEMKHCLTIVGEGQIIIISSQSTPQEHSHCLCTSGILGHPPGIFLASSYVLFLPFKFVGNEIPTCMNSLQMMTGCCSLSVSMAIHLVSSWLSSWNCGHPPGIAVSVVSLLNIRGHQEVWLGW